ncbi:MAG TPA: sigma-70 family RNA polymerase sigma factor [Thermoanaerobaculia bacterium]|jgi:RNA polymerase sigma-70 factor (ECF subfamily)
MQDIEDLYERYAGDVRRFALGLSGNEAMADEITCDTFVRAWMATERIHLPTVKSYLFAIARNLYRDVQRREARHAQLDNDMPDTRVSAQERMERSEEANAVLAALQQLPEMDRAVLLMRADGMPYEQIAETLGIPADGARVRVHRARMRLMQSRPS